MSLPCGFVTGIIHHPNRRGLVYARTDIGGAARLDLRTRRWVQLLHWIGWEEWNWTGVESLALDPSDPGRLYLAVGTYTNEWSPINGAILRSTDEGRTFRRTDLPFKLGGNEPGRSMGERLALDPRDGRVLYLGTRNQGLWRSTDRGESWARVESFQATGTAGLGRRSPGPYEMYDGAVHKVDTATGEWTDITPLRPDTGGEAGFGYAGLALDPRKPGTVMVATMSRWGPVDDIFRSVDGGVSWHSIGARIVLDTSGAPFLDFHGTPKLGWMIGDISIDPFDSDKVMYVTGATIFGSDDVTGAEAGRSTHWSVRAQGFVVRVGYGSSRQRGAYSTDAGLSWQPFLGEPDGLGQPGRIISSADARRSTRPPARRTRAPTAAPFSCHRQQICRVVQASWRQCSTGPGTVGLRRERPGSTGRPIAA